MGWVYNMGHILKPSSHHSGLEIKCIVGSNFESVGARWGTYKQILLVLDMFGYDGDCAVYVMKIFHDCHG